MRKRKQRTLGPRRSLRRPLAIIALVLAGGFAFNVYSVLRPENLRKLALDELRKSLRPDVEIESCEFSFGRGVELRGVELRWDSERRLVSIPSLWVRPKWGALLFGGFAMESIRVDSPVLTVERDGDGRWSFVDLLKRPSASAGARGDERPARVVALPAIRIESGKVLYRDAFTFSEPVEEMLDDVDVDLQMLDDGSLATRVSCSFEGVRKLTLHGGLRPVGSGYSGRLNASVLRLDLSRRRDTLRRVLPAAVSRQLKTSGICGFVTFSAVVDVTPERKPVIQDVDADIVGCTIPLEDSPYSIEELKADLHVRGGVARLENLSGRFDAGELSGDATLRFDEAYEIISWDATMRLDRFPIDSRLRAVLKQKKQREMFDLLEPSGRVSVRVDVARASSLPPEAGNVTVTARLDGLDLGLRDFPQHIRDLRGELGYEFSPWQRVKILSPIVGYERETKISIAGEGVSLKPDGPLDLNVRFTALPLDDGVRHVMHLPKAQRIWDGFQLVGNVDATFHLSRQEPQPDDAAGPAEPLRVVASAYLRGVRMKFEKFLYEITDITGTASFDSATNRLAFVDLKGRHRDQHMTGEGVVQFGSPVLLKILIEAPNLRSEPDLIAALPPQGQKLIRDFGFEGRLKTNVSIHTTARGGVEVVTDLDIIESRVHHAEFRYPIELAGGHIKLTDHHTLEFIDVRTPRGAKPAVVFDGDMVTQGADRALTFAFDIADLPFDETLVDALPGDLKEFARSFGLRGTFAGEIEGQYRFNVDDPSQQRIIYHAKNVVTQDAGVDFGLKVEQMVAKGNFVGRKEPENGHYFFGNVKVETARFNRLNLTHGDIDFAYGREHEAITAALEGRPMRPGGYVPPKVLVDRLSGPDGVPGVFQMLVHSPNVYGGQVDGFVYVDTQGDLDLGGHLVGDRFEIAKAATDVFGGSGVGTEGLGGGRVFFTGKTGDINSLRGDGEGAIRDAKLVELPLFLGILSLFPGEGSTSNYFDEITLKFDIEDGKFRAPSDGVNVSSKALILRGGGTMDFDGNLDLTFDPRIFGFEIPVVEQVVSFIKKGIAQVWVTGELKDPKVDFVTGIGVVKIGLDVSKESEVPLPSDIRERLRDGKALDGSTDESRGEESRSSPDEPKS